MAQSGTHFVTPEPMNPVTTTDLTPDDWAGLAKASTLLGGPPLGPLLELRSILVNYPFCDLYRDRPSLSPVCELLKQSEMAVEIAIQEQLTEIGALKDGALDLDFLSAYTMDYARMAWKQYSAHSAPLRRIA